MTRAYSTLHSQFVKLTVPRQGILLLFRQPKRAIEIVLPLPALAAGLPP